LLVAGVRELAAGVGWDVFVAGRKVFGSLVGRVAAKGFAERAVGSAPPAYCFVVGSDPYGFVVSVESFFWLLGVAAEVVAELSWYQ
jgi:hypothetical protein